MRPGKRVTLNISNEDMNNIIKIKKSLEDSSGLFDGVTDSEKHEIKKQESRFFWALLATLAALLVQPVTFSVVKGISGRRVREAGKDISLKIFSSASSFKQYWDY